MLVRLKESLKKTPLITPLIKAKRLFARPKCQNDEDVILRRLLSRFDVPKTFVEFGFGGWEFNCADLAETWRGLLVDGDLYNVQIAKAILPDRVESKQMWITLDSLSVIRDYVGGDPLGILSIDVDGNDYWFLESLIDLRPSIIISEYNSSLWRDPVTIPYRSDFDRREMHPRWIYYGASLSALTWLANKHGYALVEVSSSGVNAFFVRRELLTEDDVELDAHSAYREYVFAGGERPRQNWESMKHMPFIDVTTGQAQ